MAALIHIGRTQEAHGILHALIRGDLKLNPFHHVTVAHREGKQSPLDIMILGNIVRPQFNQNTPPEVIKSLKFLEDEFENALESHHRSMMEDESYLKHENAYQYTPWN